MAPLPPWFALFCAPGADRLKVLAQVLHGAAVPFELVKTGRFRHVQIRGGRPSRPGPGERVLIAHYDRVAGTPGANDNGASVLALVDYLRRPRKTLPCRVVFTDGEELGPGGQAADQGSYALARHWGAVPGLLPVVFDMTGIGDTPILGHLGEELIRRTRPEARPTELDDYGRTRLAARRWLAACAGGTALEANTPFSDDLGLFLAGIPAVQISVLPRKEALAYRRDGRLPAAWRTMHTAQDGPETLWESSRELMAELLDKLETFPA